MRRPTSTSSTDSDDELRTYLDVVTQKGEDFCGRVFGRRTIVADLPGSRWQRSRCRPSAPSWPWRGQRRRRRHRPGGRHHQPGRGGAVPRSRLGLQPHPVTYLAGYRVQPATDVMGARMLLRWLWQSQRGTIRRTAENWAPGDGWDLPNAVVGQWRDSTLSGFG